MKITNSFFQITPLIIIIAGLLTYNFISAQWQAPTATAPNNNTDAPINVSANYQAKLGDLGAVRMRAGEYCDAAGLNCVSSSGLQGAIGEGQTWQDVTSSRVCGTTYTNNTGKPIMISVRVIGHGNGPFFNVGTLTGMQVTGGYQSHNNMAFQLIIPSATTYQLQCQNVYSITDWYELRAP